MKKIILISVLIIASCLNAYCSETDVSWDAIQSADYYRVYWGKNPGQYQNTSSDVLGTEYTIFNLQAGEYYIAVKGFNHCGNFSPYSDELLVSIPAQRDINTVINSGQKKARVEPGSPLWKVGF